MLHPRHPRSINGRANSRRLRRGCAFVALATAVSTVRYSPIARHSLDSLINSARRSFVNKSHCFVATQFDDGHLSRRPPHPIADLTTYDMKFWKCCSKRKRILTGELERFKNKFITCRACLILYTHAVRIILESKLFLMQHQEKQLTDVLSWLLIILQYLITTDVNIHIKCLLY